MKSLRILTVLAALVLVAGCASFRYRIIQPPSAANSIIASQSVRMKWDPLEYRLDRVHDRLGITIMNPNADPIFLRGDRSFVVDPNGQTHPVRPRAIAPHGFTSTLWPPPQATGQSVFPAYYGPGWWPGYPYMWGSFYGSYYGPVVTYYRIDTPYDWRWDTGEAHLHLAYDRGGRQFDHDFVIVREREK